MITAFVASYGYLAIFAGTLLEGETLLVAGGFAAHSGLLAWPTVILVAITGATLGDQLAFLLGRWKGEALFARFPALAQRKPQIDALIERYDILFILTNRFLYGLRIAGPLILGSSKVPLLRFMVLNVVGAAMWAVLVSSAGVAFGFTITALISEAKRIEEVVLIAILALGSVFWLWRRHRAKLGNQAAMERKIS